MCVATADVAHAPMHVRTTLGMNPGIPSSVFRTGHTSNSVVRAAPQSIVLLHGGWFARPCMHTLRDVPHIRMGGPTVSDP